MAAERIIVYIATFLALLLVLPMHEFAHAFAAVKCGDLTPKAMGRYTLNPLAHFDALGLICFVVARFGWAKPVPVNPNNFKNYKWGCFFVAIAGVTANYILAFVFFPLFRLSLKIPDYGYFTMLLQYSLYFVYSLSISFFVFNLLPIYPLDGFRIIDSFTKRRNKVYHFLKNYGRYILLILLVLSLLSDITGISQLNILGNALNFMVKYVGYPITAFWGLFL